MGPGALAQVLQPLMLTTHPDLIVGLHTSDDAAVYRLSDDLAIIQTADFFPPIVDDPLTFGAIAAANSMSDVYAMGGEVLLALNIVAFPDSLPAEMLAEMLAGGAAKVAEAGGVVAGGHTVLDDEPKYGLSVTGRVHPDRVWRKGGARVGDTLYLTKPIGTGVISTAIKNGVAAPTDAEAAIASMSTLNRQAVALARAFEVHACTDVTGFGLLGHAHEMAVRGGVSFVVEAAAVPLLPGASGYAGSGQQPGGLRRNRAHYSEVGVEVDDAVDDTLAALLFDPQTSGGLLLALGAEDGERFAEAAEREGLAVWRIGRVETGEGVRVVAD